MGLILRTVILGVFVIAVHPNYVNVDLVEVNTVYGDGTVRFTQAILWRWCARDSRFYVSQWECCVGPIKIERWNSTVQWSNSYGRRRYVRAKSIRVTRGVDTEVEDRDILPQQDRQPYWTDQCQ